MIGRDGTVPIYHVVSQQWERRFPIDARTLVAGGEYIFDGPIPGQEAPEETTTPPAPDGTPTDLNTYSYGQLKGFAQTARIDDSDGMTKARLVQALDDIGFIP